MRKIIWIAASLLALYGAGARTADSHEHSHEAEAHGNGGLSLDHGKKWATDASLRKGMLEIRDIADKASLPGADYAKLGENVSASLNYIFKNCKLKPEADAMLHVLLARILDGAAKMKDTAKPEGQAKGAETVREALADYPRFFAHAGWKPLGR